MRLFDKLYENIIAESSIAAISTGFYQCINAENLGRILNVLHRYPGTRVLDGGLIELFYDTSGSNLDAIKLLASLFEYGYIRKYTYGDSKHHKVFRTTLLTKQQLIERIPGLELKDYTTRNNKTLK
jgi:hypothetical protein